MSDDIYVIIDGGDSDSAFLRGFSISYEKLEDLINICIRKRYSLSVNWIDWVKKGEAIQLWYGGVIYYEEK